jgi:hypothetical protein
MRARGEREQSRAAKNFPEHENPPCFLKSIHQLLLLHRYVLRFPPA